jgi:hypothetical protein
VWPVPTQLYQTNQLFKSNCSVSQSRKLVQRVLQLPRGADKRSDTDRVPLPRHQSLAVHAMAAESERLDDLGAHEAVGRRLAPENANRSSVAREALRSQTPEVGVCPNWARMDRGARGNSRPYRDSHGQTVKTALLTQRRHYRPADSDIIVVSLSLRSELFLADCCLGLMLIKFSSVAVATIAMMPPTLSAICIANPFEMSSSAM